MFNKLYIIFQGTGQTIKKDWNSKTNNFLSDLSKKYICDKKKANIN